MIKKLLKHHNLIMSVVWGVLFVMVNYMFIVEGISEQSTSTIVLVVVMYIYVIAMLHLHLSNLLKNKIDTPPYTIGEISGIKKATDVDKLDINAIAEAAARNKINAEVNRIEDEGVPVTIVELRFPNMGSGFSFDKESSDD